MMKSSKLLVLSQNCPKPKDIVFTKILNKEKQQMFRAEKLEPMIYLGVFA